MKVIVTVRDTDTVFVAVLPPIIPLGLVLYNHTNLYLT